MKNHFALLTATSLLFGCTNPIPTVGRGVEESLAREAVFRYQFDRNASAIKENAKVYCLAFLTLDPTKGLIKIDPDDEFIQRFAGHVPPVKRNSACDINDRVGVIDRTSGGPGLLFDTGAISWISGTEMQVDGGYYEAPLSSSGNSFRLKKVDGKWLVVQERMKWIS